MSQVTYEDLKAIDGVIHTAAEGHTSDDGQAVSLGGLVKELVAEYGIGVEADDLLHTAHDYRHEVLEAAKGVIIDTEDGDDDALVAALIDVIADVSSSTYIRAFLTGCMATNAQHNREDRNKLSSRDRPMQRPRTRRTR